MAFSLPSLLLSTLYVVYAFFDWFSTLVLLILQISHYQNEGISYLLSQSFSHLVLTLFHRAAHPAGPHLMTFHSLVTSGLVAASVLTFTLS